MSGKTNGMLHQDSGVRVSRSRWYVLVVASLATALQVILWGTWGPIAQSAKAVYDWQDSTLSLLFGLANIGTIVFIPPAAYVMDTQGLRVAMLLCTFAVALGSGLRLITYTHTAATWLISIGQFLIGSGASVTCSLPSLLSETWFPSNERATATAITAVSMALGSALNYIIGPAVISEPATNGSTILLNETDIHLISEQIRNLNYCQFGVAALLFLMTLVYFPTRPKHPPSVSATTHRTGFKQGIKDLVRNKEIWQISMAYSIPTGIFFNFCGLLDVVLKAIDVTQRQAGWIGFYGGMAAIVGGMLVGRFADLFKRKMKLLLTLLLVAAACCFVWMSCITSQILPKSMASLYIGAIIGAFFLNAARPLFLEITCELSYPIAEGVTGGFMTLLLNLCGSIFLLIAMTGIGVIWMPWGVVGSVVLALPLVVFFKEDYKKLNLDTSSSTENSLNGQSKASLTDIGGDLPVKHGTSRHYSSEVVRL